MRKMCLAMCLVSIALTVDSRADDVAGGAAPSRLASRRRLRAQPVDPASGQNGYNITIDPSGAGTSYRRRCLPNAARSRSYEYDYGATHGWGFPGGRWDPSLPRD